TNSQIQTIIDHFTEKPNIEFTDNPEEQDNSITNSEEVLEAKPLISTKDYEDIDDDSTPQLVKEMNKEVPKALALLTDDDSDCSHDNDSEEEMPDEKYNDDGYNGYSGYDEWGNQDRGYYYYSDGRRERKTSPMMSPIIFPVTA